MKVKKSLKINGMHCTSCAMRIDFELIDLPGVVAANTNFAKSQIEIEFDDQLITLPKIAAKIKQLGYEVAETNTDNLKLL